MVRLYAKKFCLKKPESTENEILNVVGEYLTLRKHFFFRVNNAPTFQADGHGGGFFRKQSKFSLNGVPDFILVDETGHFIGLELKRKSGKQSPEQKEFERRCKEKGAEYRVIRSIDDLQELGL